jgi:hypothetical protein
MKNPHSACGLERIVMIALEEALDRLETMRGTFEIPPSAHVGDTRLIALHLRDAVTTAWIVTYAWGLGDDKHLTELAVDQTTGGVIRWRRAGDG